jgi:DNA-binding transcriptional MocR family regulator
VPAERTLAALVGVSRGTVVACFDHLVDAGVLSRRQGAGTYVAGRPSRAARPAGSSVATMLLRRVAEDRESIDLSVSAPGDLRHLPAIDPLAAWQSLDGHGLDPAGLPALRAQPPEAGLSLWAALPVGNADAFAQTAARHGVTIMPGSAGCVDGEHRQFARLSFAEQPGTLELAAERLAAAWELHAENLAASPVGVSSLYP